MAAGTDPAGYLQTAGGGGMTFGVGEALSIAQFGFGIGQQIFGNQVQEQQAYNQAYQTAYNNSINQFRVQQANQAAADAYSAKLDYTQQQIENNFYAASSAWASEQMRLNDIYSRAAYKSQALQKMLAESMGAAAAREVYGKSAQRGAAVQVLGAYGRSRAQLVDQLISENAATAWRMEQVEQQFKGRNKLAIAQTAVQPTAATFSPTPMMPTSGPGIGQMLGGVLGAGLEAFSTGWQLTPSGGDFFGIERT